MERYAKAFWEKGSETFAAADWERHVKNVEKGERKIEEINRSGLSPAVAVAATAAVLLRWW